MKTLKIIILLFIVVFTFGGLTFNNNLNSARFDVNAFKTSMPDPLKIFSQDIDTTKWVAPASADVLVNPNAQNEESIGEGMLIYRQNCRSCHGKDGNGKGVQAAELLTPVSDFTKPEVFKQSDGALFWKISEGRNQMEPYKKKLSEEDIWYVINYIKTFTKASGE